jgi:hypothetical protein
MHHKCRPPNRPAGFDEPRVKKTRASRESAVCLFGDRRIWA